MTHNTTPHKAEMAEVLRSAADALPSWTEGTSREGTARWSEHDRDIYSLAIEDAQTALRAHSWALSNRPGVPESPALSCSALWSRNQAVSCHVTFPHTVHRGSSEPDAPSWGDGECVPGTLTAGRGGR